MLHESPNVTEHCAPSSMEQTKPVNRDVDYDLVCNFVSSQLAKGEAKGLMYNRIITSNHPTRRRRASGEPGSTHGIDHANKLVECLPQGNRCTRAPREAFINLAKAEQGSDGNAVEVIHKAFLLEEYTIQLLQEQAGVPQNDQCETVSPWALACSGIHGNQLKPREHMLLKSKRTAAQLSSALNQLKVLCNAPSSHSNLGMPQAIAADLHGSEKQASEKSDSPLNQVWRSRHGPGILDSMTNLTQVRNRRRRKRKRSAHQTNEAKEESVPCAERSEEDGVTEAHKRFKRSTSSEEHWSTDNYDSVTCSEHSEMEDGCADVSPVEREDSVVQ